jgi:hypothetical protein
MTPLLSILLIMFGVGASPRRVPAVLDVLGAMGNMIIEVEFGTLRVAAAGLLFLPPPAARDKHITVALVETCYALNSSTPTTRP